MVRRGSKAPRLRSPWGRAERWGSMEAAFLSDLLLGFSSYKIQSEKDNFTTTLNVARQGTQDLIVAPIISIELSLIGLCVSNLARTLIKFHS